MPSFYISRRPLISAIVMIWSDVTKRQPAGVEILDTDRFLSVRK